MINFSSKKNKRIMSGIIIAVLVVAMVVTTVMVGMY